MTNIYCFSDIIGDGTEEDTFRVFVETLGMSYSAAIPCDLTTGIPLNPWALTKVIGVDPAMLDGYPEIDALLDRPLTTLVADLTTQELTLLTVAFAKRGIDDAFMASAIDYAAILHGIGQAADPSFNAASVGLV